MSETPQHQPGDVVNGHVLTSSGQWVPLPSAAPLPPTGPLRKKTHKVRNSILGVVGAIVVIGALAGGGEDEKTTADPKPAASVDTKADASPAVEPAVDEVVEEPVVEEPVVEEPAMTTGQEQAVRSAESYLDYSAFSRSGLIEQLEFEGYSTKDATFAVDNIEVNWKQQAAKSAKSYLEYSSFSRSGLIEQLEFEGFTTQQATFGVNQTGL